VEYAIERLSYTVRAMRSNETMAHNREAQMRLSEPDAGIVAQVSRYLLPSERAVITVRIHPAMLLRSLSFLVCALVAVVVMTALVVADDLPHVISHYIALIVIWVVWSLIALRFLKRIAEWRVNFIIVTNQRIIGMWGLFVRTVAMLPLSEISDLSFRRSTCGRLFDYGTIIVESAGGYQALQAIDHVPGPEEFYQQTVSLLLFPSEGTRIVCPTCHGEGMISESIAEPAEADQDVETSRTEASDSGILQGPQ
jgi:membrane protein YdbS with pleckstrin-like domain